MKKLNARTIRLDPQLDEAVERLAAADRRPTAQFLRLLVADAVAARSRGGAAASSGDAAAAA
jgi:predicted transcriptional regulator